MNVTVHTFFTHAHIENVPVIAIFVWDIIICMKTFCSVDAEVWTKEMGWRWRALTKQYKGEMWFSESLAWPGLTHFPTHHPEGFPDTAAHGTNTFTPLAWMLRLPFPSSAWIWRGRVHKNPPPVPRDTDKWPDVVITILNFRVPLNARNYLTVSGTVSFFRRALLHRVSQSVRLLPG